MDARDEARVEPGDTIREMVRDDVTEPFDVDEAHARIETLLSRQIDRVRREESGEILLSGSTQCLGLPDLLQVLCMNGTEGVVVLAQGACDGRIVLAGGRIVHAECGPVFGVKALYRMLGWASASFRLIRPVRENTTRTIDVPTANLIMDGLVSLDEWHRRSRDLPPTDTRVARRPAAGGELSAAQREVLRLAGFGATIREILDRDPRPDSQVAGAVCECLKRDVLRTVA